MEWPHQAIIHLTASQRGPLIQFGPTAPPPRVPPAPARQTPTPLIKQGEPAGEIGRGFRAAKERLTLRAPKPPPPKKSKRGGEDEKRRPPAALTKKIVMKFKMAWRWLTEARDNRPTFDYETYRRWQQSAAMHNEPERGFRAGRPNYPSPNL